MARATQPVDINGITFDVLIEENLSLAAYAPHYPVETGFEVSDSIILSPQVLEMTLFLTHAPVTWLEQHGTGEDRVHDVIEQLKELYFAKEPVTITTTDATYENMAILDIGLSKVKETGTAREIPISFQEIRIAESRTAALPDSYGKSGTTGTNAGAANTKSSATPASSGSSSPSEDSGSRGTLLYNLTNRSGL